jgi:Cof subfamily protein (haloacid dehalogenase superfamily)
MELIVFDLDGTLLNKQSTFSDFTRETLQALGDRGIAYTVATGRTLHGSRQLLEGHGFTLPQIYKNGVIIWQPDLQSYSHRNLLSLDEIRSVIEAFMSQGISPFVFTLEPGDRHAIYHPPLQSEAERKLARVIGRDRGLEVLPVADIPADADITNISALGPRGGIDRVQQLVADQEHLVAYAGTALEGNEMYWIDVHHSSASKGGAVEQLKLDLGIKQVICFGDSDNDLSMFAAADECYAPSNAKDPIKAAATAVIGHHDEDGIASFLRERFAL